MHFRRLVTVTTFLQLCWNRPTLLLSWPPTSADLLDWAARHRLCPNTVTAPAGTASREGSTQPEEGVRQFSLACGPATTASGHTKGWTARPPARRRASKSRAPTSGRPSCRRRQSRSPTTESPLSLFFAVGHQCPTPSQVTKMTQTPILKTNKCQTLNSDVEISSISFKNFKTFQDQETFAETKKLNFLIGPNGVGKTNVWKGVNKIKELFNGRRNLVRNDHFDKNDKEIHLSLTFKLSASERRKIIGTMNSITIPEKFLWRIKYSVQCDTKRKINEFLSIDSGSGEFLTCLTVTYSNKSAVAQTIDLNDIAHAAPTKSTGQFNTENIVSALKQFNPTILALLQKFFESVVHVPSQRIFTGVITPAESKDISLDGGSLANEINTIFQTNRPKRDRYEKNVKQIAPHINQINTPPKGNNITVEIHEDGLANEIAHDELSNGYHQSLILPHIIQNSDPRIFFLEEPELHLHAQSQKALLDIIRSNDQHQFFIETHSPIFTGFSDSEATFLISKNGGASSVLTISSDNIAPIKHELGLAHSDIYEHDLICFVEGPSEREAFHIIARRANHEIGHKLYLWTLGGYGQLNNIKTLLHYLQLTGRKIFVIVDKNGEASRIIDKLNADKAIKNNCVYMLDGNFEDQFSSNDIIESMRKISQKHGFAFELTAAELDEKRKNKPVDKILRETLHNIFNISKPKLAIELANTIDLSSPDRNPFVECVIKILDNQA